MEEDNVSGIKPRALAEKPLSKIEKLNKTTWYILSFLVGGFFLMMGFGIGKNLSIMFFGAFVMATSFFLGLMQYSGKEILSKGAKRRWEIFVSKITQGIVIILFIAVGFGIIDNVLRDTEKLNSEQMKISGSETKNGQRNFLTYACKAKAVCKSYPDVKQGCAAAGSIQKCIDIRMKGEDSSMCLDNGEVVGFDDKTRPSFAQCMAFKISEFLN